MIIAQSLIAPPERELNPNWIDGIVPVGVIGLFTAKQYVPHEGPFAGTVFFYRLFEPSPIDPSKTYPILIWASGYGEMGDDNFAQLRHLHYIFQDPDTREKYPFYCLVLQVSKDIGAWIGPEDEFDMADVLMEILGHTIEGYPIDADRIYLSGVSYGGDVCWELAMRHPQRFAAVAPLAGSGRGLDRERLKEIINVPIWAFHSIHDPNTPIGPDQQAVNLLRDLGGIAYLTEVDSRYHDCWTSAFLDHDLMSWLLAQRRGQTCIELPGRGVQRWWHIAIPLSGIAIVYFAVRSEIIRKRKRRNSNTATESWAN